jgi:hypothetical protein
MVKDSSNNHVQKVLRRKPWMDWRSERDCANTVYVILHFTPLMVASRHLLGMAGRDEKKLTTGNMIVLMSDLLKRWKVTSKSQALRTTDIVKERERGAQEEQKMGER